MKVEFVQVRMEMYFLGYSLSLFSIWNYFIYIIRCWSSLLIELLFSLPEQMWRTISPQTQTHCYHCPLFMFYVTTQILGEDCFHIRDWLDCVT